MGKEKGSGVQLGLCKRLKRQAFQKRSPALRAITRCGIGLQKQLGKLYWSGWLAGDGPLPSAEGLKLHCDVCWCNSAWLRRLLARHALPGRVCVSLRAGGVRCRDDAPALPERVLYYSSQVPGAAAAAGTARVAGLATTILRTGTSCLGTAYKPEQQTTLAGSSPPAASPCN